MVKNLYELDNSLSDLEIAHNKANTICDDLKQGYFSGGEPDELLLKCGYQSAETKMDILTDYLFEIKKAMEALRESVNEEFEIANCKTE